MNSQTVFEVIAKIKQDFIDWDELAKPCDAAVKKAMIASFEELESRLREHLINDSSIVCGCGCLIESVETLYEHKKFCDEANR